MVLADKGTKAGDSLLTLFSLSLSTYAGARIAGMSAWECENPNFGYSASQTELKDCLSRPEGLLRRWALAALMTTPAFLILLQIFGLVLSKGGSKVVIVRGLSVLGSLGGISLLACQLAGVFFEKTFFCQCSTFSYAALPDIRSYECFSRTEENFDQIMYSECMILMVSVVWNIFCMVRREVKKRKAAAGGGDNRLGEGKKKFWSCWRQKNSQDSQEVERMEQGAARAGDENAVYTSETRGSDEAGEGTYNVPFKTVMKAMKHAAKEPFPPIYVDVKPDSDAAKSGAKYELIAKAQLKKVTKLWQQEDKKDKIAKSSAASAAMARSPPPVVVTVEQELRRQLEEAENKLRLLEEKTKYLAMVRNAMASDENGDMMLLEWSLVDMFTAKRDHHGVVRWPHFSSLMNQLLVTPKKHGLTVPDPSQYRAIFRRYDGSRYGSLTLDEWIELAKEEVFKKII